jgi:serine/threonine protein kinase HipA of HipAB toxin-antitoxin module
MQRSYAVFNVMIGNTDDHLKNFLMLHDELETPTAKL